MHQEKDGPTCHMISESMLTMPHLLRV
uniref:Uncharacterized protein n=1 Tax=Arundo donax TaxID=35708 RepID=A0A0A9ETY2_ARUDO